MPQERRVPLLRALGSAIAEIRRGAGLSQADLSERSGLDAKAISAIERGKRNPSYVILDRLAQGMGTTISTIAARAERAT